MSTIDKQVHIDRPPAEVWSLVGDVGGISSWFPGLASSSADDTQRRCELDDGAGTLVEEIVAYDDTSRSYEYRLTDAPMPVDAHHAWVKVDAEGDGSRVSWVTEVEPPETAEMMDGMFDQALAELKERLES